MCVCVYTYIHVCVCVYIYIYTYVSLYVHMTMHWLHVQKHVISDVLLQVHASRFICACVRTIALTHTHTHTRMTANSSPTTCSHTYHENRPCDKKGAHQSSIPAQNGVNPSCGCFTDTYLRKRCKRNIGAHCKHNIGAHCKHNIGAHCKHNIGAHCKHNIGAHEHKGKRVSAHSVVRMIVQKTSPVHGWWKSRNGMEVNIACSMLIIHEAGYDGKASLIYSTAFLWGAPRMTSSYNIYGIHSTSCKHAHLSGKNACSAWSASTNGMMSTQKV